MLLTRHQLRHAAQLQAPVGGGLVGCRWCGGKRGMKQSAENATQTRHRLASNSGEQNMTNVPELCAAGDCWDDFRVLLQFKANHVIEVWNHEKRGEVVELKHSRF
ncbi:uncharacterized protein [Narcine bancroftii]|uniref:uncharacterized protein isoform X4 n=1 Tax=Narcine bancroftii TaxID=1343680 RepID=UPI003831BD14